MFVLHSSCPGCHGGLLGTWFSFKASVVDKRSVDKGCPHCVYPGAYIVDGVTITGNDESRIFELYHSVLHGLFIGSYCPIDLKCSQHCLWSCQWPRQHHCDLIDHPCKTAWIGSLTFLTALSAHCFTSYLSTNKPLINPLYPHYAPLSSRGAWLVDL